MPKRPRSPDLPITYAGLTQSRLRANMIRVQRGTNRERSAILHGPASDADSRTLHAPTYSDADANVTEILPPPRECRRHDGTDGHLGPDGTGGDAG